MQKLSIDIETKFLCDLEEKIHGLAHIAVEKSGLVRMVINEVRPDRRVAFTYHLSHTCAHAYHIHKKVASDNGWTGWSPMISCFEEGKVRRIFGK